MSVPKVATLNNLLAHHKSKGTKPKCSVFHLLPNRLVMDIIKVELDRQRDTIDYWCKLIPRDITKRKLYGDEFRQRLACINNNIRALGKLNQSVKAVGYFVKKIPFVDTPNGRLYFPTDPRSKRIPQKDCSAAQKKATKKSDINYSCAIIRHFRARYQVKDYIRENREVMEVIARMKSKVCSPAADIDEYQVRIAKISIRVNYDRHQ